MRRFFVILIIPTLFAGLVFADGIWKSSFTQTADSNQALCTTHRATLHSVCISSPTVAASTVSVFVSTNTAIKMTVVDGTRSGCLFYDTVAISTNTNALAYTTSAAGSVNIQFN